MSNLDNSKIRIRLLESARKPADFENFRRELLHQNKIKLDHFLATHIDDQNTPGHFPHLVSSPHNHLSSLTYLYTLPPHRPNSLSSSPSNPPTNDRPQVPSAYRPSSKCEARLSQDLRTNY